MSRPAALPKALLVAAFLGFAAVSGLIVPSCSNPVQDQAIAALGGEANGIPKGPFHRPGQPCLACHSENGPTTLIMVVGGTVFTDLVSLKPAAFVSVIFTDSIGQTQTATTNECGNFWIPASSWNAKFPLAAEIHYPIYNADGSMQMEPDPQNPGNMIPVTKVKAMGSVISRDGGCADCHKLTGRGPTKDASGNVIAYESTGWIYCNAAGESAFFPAAPPECQQLPFPGSTSATSTSTSTSASSTSSSSAGGGAGG